ncbi:hypothetical protein [Methylobacterium nonmethylotrophicum]|uniref:Flagellar protein FlaG n=1 Tax=Methylobacterium nonmethylotrophicum TaxID=1141884 RepID=A0A4Z0NE40_9HYPH|nr:hypothetical protein [Methylobacterium nonmethylotrophicum]TGD94290.1 hypothetical protein EU555_32230 [Methylobacterium nonmethylotrophicum]
MIETSSLAAAYPPAAVDPIVRISPARPPQTGAGPSLESPVTLDLSPDARQQGGPTTGQAQESPEAVPDRAHYRRDLDSQEIVFQVVDPDGAVVEQLPSEAALRARTYARQVEAARTTEIGTSVARSA